MMFDNRKTLLGQGHCTSIAYADGKFLYYVCADGVVTEYACDASGRRLATDGTVTGYAQTFVRGRDCYEYARGEVRRVDC
jgi:YD repeat-containing protein